MASSFSSLPSEPLSSFSLPQLKRSATSEKTSTTSAAGVSRPRRIVWKSSLQGKNKTLDATNGEESAKYETKKDEKQKRTFSTFSVSLGREKIEADLLAMSGRSAAKKKRTTRLQSSFQDYLPSFSTDNSSNAVGSRYNLASEKESTSTDGGSKITRKFSTATDKKNEDVVMVNSVDQTLVSTEFEEPEKVKTLNNTKKVSDAVNQTLLAKNCNVAESIQHESTQLAFVPFTKDNEEKNKRTFSTFSVSLTREEIEGDFISMGGSMRTRRIKKRPKNVQRQLDNLFPGLRLKYITPDDYRVREDKN